MKTVANKLQPTEIQVILSVFELKVSVTKAELNNLLPEERDLFQTLPQIDKQKLDKIKKDIGSFPAEQILSKSLYPFTFSSLNVKKIISFYNPELIIPRTSAIYIFYTVIAYLFFQQQVVPSDQFTMLITGLFRTINVPGMVTYSSFFFQLMMNLAVTFPMMYWDEQLIYTVCEYIETDTNLSETFYYTLVNICSLIFSLNKKNFTKSILITLNKLYKGKYKCIMVNDQTEMMQYLTPLAVQPHPLIFEIVPAISQISQCQAVLDMYVNFVSHLYKQFYEDPITINLNQKKMSQLKLPEIKNSSQIFDYSFDNLDHSSFPKGILSLPPELCQTIELRQKFPSSIWNYLSILSPFLQKSHSLAVDFFFQSLIKFIITSKATDYNLYFSIMMSIVFLMKENATHNRLQVFVNILVSKKLFNPDETIFQEDGFGIDSTLNYFRNQVISLLAEKDISIIMEELLDEKHPLLFTEIIARLLPLKCSLEPIINNESFFTKMMNFASYFQLVDKNNHSYSITINLIRSIYLLFIEKASSFDSFRNKQCFSIFCKFLFDIEITDHILYILRKNFYLFKSDENIEVIEKNISLILSKCAEKSDDERYSQLSIKISETFLDSMRINNIVVHSVERIFSSFMNCFKSKPSDELNLIILKMIRLISSLDDTFSLSTESIYVLSKFAKENKKYEKECLIYLLSILTNSRVQKINEINSLFIVRPKFLLLLLASFGNSPRFVRFFDALSIGCQYSFNTAKKCHEGHLDIILLEFLEKETETAIIQYEGIEIELTIPKEKQKEFIVPLLISILSASSSYSVLSLLHKLCQNKNSIALTIYEESIANCSMNVLPIYLISSLDLDTKLSSNALNTKTTNLSFAQNFSFSFWFKLDFELLHRFNPIITFLKIYNKKAALSVCYMNYTLVLQLEINGKVGISSLPLPIVDTKVTIKHRLKEAKKWHYLGLSFLPEGELQSVQVVYDGALKSKAMKLPSFTFSKLGINAEIGLCNLNDTYNCKGMGYISKISLFDRSLTIKELIQIYDEDFYIENNLLLFNVLTPFIKSQNIIDLYTEEIALKGLITSFGTNLNMEFLLNLKNIFTFVPYSQHCFLPLIDCLVDYLFQTEKRDFSHYMTLYSIFEEISYEPLQIEWFDKILVNMDLWMRDEQLRLSIVSHWYSILFINHQNLFAIKSKFSEFFIQFIIYFKQLKEVVIHSIKFLANLAYLNFNDVDTRIFFDIVFGSTQSEYLHFYLTILECITPVLKKDDQEECLDFLHALINQQLQEGLKENYFQNTFQILSIIYNIEIVDNNLEALILTKLFSSSPDHLIELLKSFSQLETLPNYPELYFCLLLSIPRKKQFDSNFYSNFIQRIWTQIKIDDELWFLWPLVFAFNTDYDNQQLIFELMAKSTMEFSNSASKINSMETICSFSDFLAAISIDEPEDDRKVNKTHIYLTSLVNSVLQNQVLNKNADTNFVDDLVNQILYSVFYHINWESHNKYFMYVFDRSPFAQPFTPSKQFITKRNVFSVDDIIELALISPPNSIGFQLKFTKTGQIEGLSLVQSTVPLIQLIKDKHDYIEIIKHFAMNNKLIKKGIKLFDRMKKDYCDQFMKSVETVFRSINTLSNMLKNIEKKIKMFDFKSYEKLMKQVLVNPSDKVIRKKKMDVQIEYVRSCSCGSCEYPLKMKNKVIDHSKKKIPIYNSNENDNFYYDKNYCINYSGDKYDKNYYKNFNLIGKNASDDYPIQLSLSYQNGAPIPSNNISASSSMSTNKIEFSIPKALLIKIRKKEQVQLQITKDEFRVISEESGEKIIKFSDIENCYLSGESKFELHTTCGCSLLFDISPHLNSILTKFLGIKTSTSHINSSSSSVNDTSNNRNSFIFASNSIQSKIVQSVNPKFDWTSNFEYLLHLNFVSGRSFNNPELYPIFPQYFNFDDISRFSDNVSSSVSKVFNSMHVKTLELQWNDGPHMPIKIRDLFSNPIVFPEVYFFPELFRSNADLSQNDKSGTVGSFLLPSWSNRSQYEFVYKMRKLLESPAATKALPKWIDIVWGDQGNMYNQQRKHSTLFTSPHPPKQAALVRKFKHQLVLQVAKTDSAAAQQTVTNSSDVILALCNDDIVGVLTNSRKVIFNKVVIDDTSLNLSKARTYNLENALDDKSLYTYGPFILTYNKQSFLLTVFRSSSKAIQKTIICAEPMFRCFDENTFAYLSDNSTVSFFDLMQNVGSSHLLNDIVSTFDITLFEVSKKFGLVVYATSKNDVFVCSLPKGNVVKMVHLDQSASRITITESWGFIVIYSEILDQKDNCKAEIVVLNVNGTFVKKHKLEAKLSFWKPICSIEGFDYILFLSENDTLGAFEALFPEKQCSLCEAKDLVEAHYLKVAQVIIIMTKSGKISVHPISLPSLFSEL